MNFVAVISLVGDKYITSDYNLNDIVTNKYMIFVVRKNKVRSKSFGRKILRNGIMLLKLNRKKFKY